MKNKIKTIIFLILLVLFVFGAWLVKFMQNRVPDNPPGTVGNTAGNLNNGGTFCEEGGRVYFSNAYDSNTLYSMNPDETDIRKLNYAQVSYINAAGNYLYYYQKNSSVHEDFNFITRTYGLYRCKKNGRGIECLERTDCGCVSLADNTLFYTKPVDGAETLQLFSIKTDKTKPQMVSDHLTNPASVRDGVIYYNDTVETHHLYSYDTRSGLETLIKEYDMWNPTLQGSFVYFIDLEGDYRLCSYNLSDDTVTVLATDKVEAFNLTSYYAYYQTFDTEVPALWRVSLTGGSPELVAEGVYTDICTTSEYVYFRSFAAELPIYHTPADGAVAVSSFEGASAAAIKELK